MNKLDRTWDGESNGGFVSFGFESFLVVILIAGRLDNYFVSVGHYQQQFMLMKES